MAQPPTTTASPSSLISSPESAPKVIRSSTSHPNLRRPRVSNINTGATLPRGKSGQLAELNHHGNGHREEVPIELLQSLYLSRPFSPTLSERSMSTTRSRRQSSLGHSREGSSNLLRSIRENSHAALSEALLESPVLEDKKWPDTITYTQTMTYPAVRRLPARDRKRILVTGGAGFVGSHLVDRLMCMGHDVVVLDNFFSGTKTGVAQWIGHPSFELVRSDVVEPFMIECDQIFHLACPASPKAYQLNAIKTLKTNFMGTMNMLGLAKRVKARFLLSSTSEVYGSPTVHPQAESYWGNVNPIGPRACYDEGKRVAEALTYGYHRQDGVDVRVARIFNCFGPRMSSNDGRLVSNFIMAALRGEPVEVYGDGTQTRSLMFIQDLVSGLIELMESNCTEPVNLGTEEERTVEEWAQEVIDVVEDLRERGEVGWLPPSDADSQTDDDEEALEQPVENKKSTIVHTEAVVDDPPRRKPDITRAKTELGWEPRWGIRAGIEETVRYFWAMEHDEEA